MTRTHKTLILGANPSHPAGLTEAGYRLFTDEDVAVLRFFRQAKALDLSLAEIKDILDLQRGGATPGGRSPNCSTPTSPRSTAPWPTCAIHGAP